MISPRYRRPCESVPRRRTKPRVRPPTRNAVLPRAERPCNSGFTPTAGYGIFESILTGDASPSASSRAIEKSGCWKIFCPRPSLRVHLSLKACRSSVHPKLVFEHAIAAGKFYGWEPRLTHELIEEAAENLRNACVRALVRLPSLPRWPAVEIPLGLRPGYDSRCEARYSSTPRRSLSSWKLSKSLTWLSRRPSLKNAWHISRTARAVTIRDSTGHTATL